MRYQNRVPEEGINVSDEHPLKEFGQLVIGIVSIAVISVIILSATAGFFAKRIPFSFENKMVGDLDWFASETESPELDELERLADRLSQHMDLPEDMQIRMHYSADGTINALATLGGNVVFFKGLTDLVQSEDELAMVMAHEIAHVKLRHPIVAAGKGVTLASFAAVLTGVSGSTAGQWLIGSTTNLSMMSFSREQESAADALAANALVQEFGHLQGAQDLFQRFAELEDGSVNKPINIEAFNSHPFSEKRWSAVEKLAQKNGWQLAGETTPLSKVFRDNVNE